MIILNLLTYFIVILVFLFNFTISQTWNSDLQQRYDGYGQDWIFMPDGNDQPQVAVLKHAENDERDIFDESEISFILYTRYL